MHRREYEDCKQILKLSLTPRTNKTPGKTSASTAVRRLAYGQSGIRRLSVRICCAPALYIGVSKGKEEKNYAISNNLFLDIRRMFRYICKNNQHGT